MGLWTTACQQRLLCQCSSMLRSTWVRQVTGPRLALHHETSDPQWSKDSAVRPGTERQDSGSKTTVSNGLGQGQKWSEGKYQHPAQNKALKKSNPVQRRPQEDRRAQDLHKLSFEDFAADTEKPVRGDILRKAKDDRNYEVVFGISPCLLAITIGRRKAYKLLVKDGEVSSRTSVIKVCEEAHRRGVQIKRVTKKHLDRISTGRVHQGVCLEASPLSYLTEETACTSVKGSGKTPLWLVLDGIQDPMNLGAILRSAYFLGVDRVATSLTNSCPLTPVVSKASSGAMEAMDVYGYESLEEMLKLKVSQGWHVVGTVGAQREDSSAVTRCSDFHLTKPTLLLMGGEGEGVSQKLFSHCQTFLTIPPLRQLVPGVESLNVSVATGILLHSLLLHRTPESGS